MASSQITYESVSFAGRDYDLRHLTYFSTHDKSFTTVVVGPCDLSEAVCPNGEAHVDITARYLDERIFFYIEENLMLLPERELVEYLRLNTELG